MRFLLDTNICIHFFRGNFDLLQKFSEENLKNCAISEITLAELVFGAEKSQHPKRNHQIIDEFSSQIAILPIFDSILLYGKEKARLRNSGIMISDFDLLIGCTAVVNDLTMVTENLKEFERISNIQLENWIQRK